MNPIGTILARSKVKAEKRKQAVGDVRNSNTMGPADPEIVSETKKPKRKPRKKKQ